MSNMSKLRNWHRTPIGTLRGQVYHDHRWTDGTQIRTTVVVSQERMGDALIAHTQNTTYELCRQDGAEWFAQVEAPVVEEGAS